MRSHLQFLQLACLAVCARCSRHRSQSKGWLPVVASSQPYANVYKAEKSGRKPNKFDLALTFLRGGEARKLDVSQDPAMNAPNQTAIPAWKQALPAPLRSKGPKTLQLIRLGLVDIYLLGTAHVSNDSSTETRFLLEHVNPDGIFVELCDARIALLEGPGEVDPSNLNATNETMSFWQKVKSTQDGQGGSRLQALSTVLLTNVQEDYASELGVELGGEFRCAHTYWLSRTSPRPHLILGDRPLQLTLVRAWESLWWWPKLKVLVALLWSSWQKPNKEEIRKWLDSVMKEETDILTESFQELRKHFPTLYATIVAERDAYLAAKLIQTCRGLTLVAQKHQTGRKRVVAVVGAGHVPGICDFMTNSSHLKSPEEVLSDLVVTRKWAHDPLVQNEAIPMWVTQVTELSDQKNTNN